MNQLAGKIKKLMKGSLFAHSINTLKFANQIAEKQKSEIDIYRLSVSCLLHDYGKIFDREQLK
ncbi:MAG: HD domain-containing protein, partial [Actinobacteria bacterium]|nr:HD domain-containing protein [Actinomycetota bacterium]